MLCIRLPGFRALIGVGMIEVAERTSIDLPIMADKHPLDSYAKIRSRQPAEFESAILNVYNARLLELRSPSDLNVHANFVQLTEIALGFARTATSVTVRFDEVDYARLQLPLRGNGITRRGLQTVVVGPTQPCIVSEGEPSEATYGADLENLFLRVKSGSLERKVGLLTGRTVSRKLQFEIGSFEGAARFSALRRLIELLVQQLDDTNSRISPLALRELEEATILQLLYASRHNLSADLEQDGRDADSAAVRRVADYIDANWNSAIRIEDLVLVSGVSARTLFRTFEKSRGLSPMALVKKTRLQHARLLLNAPHHHTSVTGVALGCGFSNLGQFARDYQAAFGELPSVTLQRSKAR